MEYTKGEWKYNCPYIDTTEGHRIAQVYNYWAPGYSDNAKLLVAAPDMYEVIKQFVRYANQWQRINGNFPNGDGRSLILTNMSKVITQIENEEF